MKYRNTLAAVLLLGFLTVGAWLALSAFFEGGALREQLGLLRRDAGQLPAFLGGGAETAVNEDLDRDHRFIQLFGGFQRLTGRRVVEDADEGSSVARLDNGALNFVELDAALPDCAGNGERTAAFARALEERGFPCLFVLAPQKIPRGADVLPAGVHNYGNEGADLFLSVLDAEGTDFLDLRPLFEGTGNYADWFFRTDHHWRPEAAFYAWAELTHTLAERFGLDTRPELADPARWETAVLEDFFLGSQGKRVGSLFAGTDDFTVYTPRFDTSLTYTCPFYAIDRSGSFSESVCFPERIAEKDWFGGNPYTYYAGGDYPIAKIVNHSHPDGARIVLIRDSFACALTPFLALSCSELTTIDLRYFQGNLLETIEALQPDLVMTLYTTGTCAAQAMFAFECAGQAS